MKTLLISITSLIITVSCNSHNKKTDLDKNLKNAIDEYIDSHPLQVLGKISFQGDERVFPHPVYQLYFDKVEKDTILSIITQSSFNPFEFKFYEINESESYLKMMESEGVYFYKKKYPLVVFDYGDYSKLYFKQNELIEVPDSLQPTFENVHIDPDQWNFKLKDGVFVRLNND